MRFFYRYQHQHQHQPHFRHPVMPQRAFTSTSINNTDEDAAAAASPQKEERLTLGLLAPAFLLPCRRSSRGWPLTF
jgi:hypothetical protein